MKLLPRKIDIDKQKSIERKAEVDSGVKLAQSVDKLRETKLAEQKQLKEWRETATKAVQQEIDSYLEVKENLRIATEQAEKYRKELIVPLDKEWAEVNQTKARLVKEGERVFLANEQLTLEELKVENERQKVSEIVSRVTQNEQTTAKAKEEAISLKDLAHREYEMARAEHDTQTARHERELQEVAQERREYEVALSVIAIRENEVKEKEVDIIKREQHLETQQKALRVAREVLKL